MNLVEVKYENIAVVYEEMGKVQMGLTMQKISEDYEDVFTGEGEFQKEIHLEVDETISPVKQPVRRIPVASNEVQVKGRADPTRATWSYKTC